MKRSYQSNRVRLIGGKYRRRLLSFPTLAGLRPTTDRTRETLFNWLTPYIQDARVVDLFAGSGALGFESLSRGAREAIFIDADPQVLTYLRQSADLLKIITAHFLQGQVPHHIQLTGTFDIVFVDPPFNSKLQIPTLQWLYQQQLVTQQSLVFVEFERHDLLDQQLPKEFTIYKETSAGNVVAYLLKRLPSS